MRACTIIYSHVFAQCVKTLLAAIISQPLFLSLLKQEASRGMTPLMQNLFLPNQKEHPAQCNDKRPPCLWCFFFLPSSQEKRPWRLDSSVGNVSAHTVRVCAAASCDWQGRGCAVQNTLSIDTEDCKNSKVLWPTGETVFQFNCILVPLCRWSPVVGVCAQTTVG